MKLRDIIFDDYTVMFNNNGYAFSQICEACRSEYNLTDDDKISICYNKGNRVCGVKGCDNKSDHYINLR